jgi:hypothetical protein
MNLYMDFIYESETPQLRNYSFELKIILVFEPRCIYEVGLRGNHHFL